MSMKSCFLFGHRNAPFSVRPALSAAIEQKILQNNVTEFIVGQYGYFDAMAAGAIRELKTRYPSICLTILLPSHPAERSVELPKDSNGSFYPPGMEAVPRRFAIVRANQYMLRHCDSIICYVRNPAGNTYKLLTLARHLGLPAHNLGSL